MALASRLVCTFQLNESSGRLPTIAQLDSPLPPPRAALMYFMRQVDPASSLATPGRRVRSMKTTSVDKLSRQDPSQFIKMRQLLLNNGTAEYFLFVEWFEDDAKESQD